MGHYAKSFALKDQPGNFVSKHSEPKPLPPMNRLTYNKDRQSDIQKSKAQQNDGKKRKFSTMVEPGGARMPRSMNKQPLSLTTSEFDSGLPALKKKKKN